MAITIDGIQVKMPQEWAPTLLKQAFEESVVGKLCPAEPMPLSGKTIPVYGGGFEVGYVAEGTAKPVSDVTIEAKSIVPIKLAGITLVSSEATKLNPGKMLDIMQTDMRNAISRGVDYGVLYGKSANSGAKIPGAVAVNDTTKRVTLDTKKDLVPQLLGGYDKAAEGLESDPSGFMFDSRLRTKIAVASQQTGTTVKDGAQRMPNLAVAADTVAGLPAAYGRVVSGRIGTQTGETPAVLGFVGDWSKIRWGFAEQIELTRSDQASVVAGGKTYHLFQDNMVAYRIEVTVGWTVLDTNAFAAYTASSTTTGS